MAKQRSENGVLDIDSFVRTCRANNLKLTPQRMMLFKELWGSMDHPSAESLYRKARKKFPNISFDTVNRTLLTFSKLGIIKVVEGYGSPRRFDPNPIPHHHFRCIHCEDIIDIYDRNYDKLDISPDIDGRFTVLHKRVVLEGICDGCRKKGRKSGNG